MRKPLLIGLAFLLLYFFFRTVQFDPNGVLEAMNLNPGSLVSVHHIIYRPVGYAVYRAAEMAGYQGRSIYVLQVLNIFCGAVTVGLAFAAFKKLGAADWAAFAAAILLGTSFIHWWFSTDVAYVTMAGMFAAAALLFAAILHRAGSRFAAFGMGLFFALATLTWEAAVFLFPVLLWPLRRRYRELWVFLISSVFLMAGSYVAVGLTQDLSSPGALLRWATNYGGVPLPDWGRLDLNRVPLSVENAAISIHLYSVDGVKEFIRHPLRINTLRRSASSLSFTLLLLFSLYQALKRANWRHGELTWLTAGYLAIVPFITWWSPEGKWFLVPNVFLCGVAALVWSSSIFWRAGKMLVFGAIAIMAFGTFTSWIWPRHLDPGVTARKVDCIAQNIRPLDTVIAPDWYWTADLIYFHGIPALEIVTYGSFFHDRPKLLAYMDDELLKTRRRGGRAFIVDPSSYNAEYLRWLAEQTTFTAADFDRFPGRFAFQCEDAKFRQVTFSP